MKFLADLFWAIMMVICFGAVIVWGFSLKVLADDIGMTREVKATAGHLWNSIK